MYRWLVLVVAACGSTPAQLPAPVASVAPAPPAAAPVPAPAAGPWAKLRAIIGEHDLRDLAIEDAYGTCRSMEAGRMIIASHGTSCLVVGSDIRCVAMTTDARIACEDAPPAVATPAWADALAGYLRSDKAAAWISITPIRGANALALGDGDGTTVLANTGERWLASTKRIGVYANAATIPRAFDASLLAKQPAIAVIAESRDGGSGMGSAIDQLVVLCVDGDTLRTCGEIEIGHLEWVLDAEHRSKYPGAESSLRKRPHIEVELEPTLIAPDVLLLTVKRDSQLPMPKGSSFDSELLATMAALRTSGGRYRLVDGEFVRAD